MDIKKLDSVDVKGKKVLVRVDFNVPLDKKGNIEDDTRIVASLPTINYLIEKGAKLIIFSHLGRIKTVEDKATNSMVVCAERLSEKLGKEVKFIPETRGEKLEQAINELNDGDVLVFENTRFEDLEGNKESKNNPELGAYWASLGDIFVNDAFGTAHRAHASNVGIASNIAVTLSGYLLEKEIEYIGGVLANPKRPFVAILGGAKVSDKIEVIKNLLKVADYVLIGGAMAYTFYKAQGYEIGTSKVEDDKLDLAKELLELGKDKIILGVDVVTNKEFKNVKGEVYEVGQIPSDVMGLDIGPATIEKFASYIKKAKTIVWNGPVGVFEFKQYEKGTKKIAQLIAKNKKAISIVGGGDSAAAVAKFGLEAEFTHISTGGGASLEYLEGKELPGVTIVLEDCCGDDCDCCKK